MIIILAFIQCNKKVPIISGENSFLLGMWLNESSNHDQILSIKINPNNCYIAYSKTRDIFFEFKNFDAKEEIMTYGTYIKTITLQNKIENDVYSKIEISFYKHKQEESYDYSHARIVVMYIDVLHNLGFPKLVSYRKI